MSKCSVRRTCQRKFLYWTLFWPKNWAAALPGRSGSASARTIRATNAFGADRIPARSGSRSTMFVLMLGPPGSPRHRRIPRLPQRFRHRFPWNRPLGRLRAAAPPTAVALADIAQQGAHGYCTRRGRKVRPRSLLAADEKRGTSLRRDQSRQKPRLLGETLRDMQRHNGTVGPARSVG